MAAELLTRDWRSICDTIFCLNGCSNLDDFQSVTARRLLTLIPCIQTTLFIATDGDDEAPYYDRIEVAGQPARFLDQFMEGDYGTDNYLMGFEQPSNHRAFRDSDLLPESYRIETPLYKDIYEPQGIHYALRAYLSNEGKTIGNISLFKTREEGDFSPRDVEILDILIPHIALKLGQLIESEGRNRSAKDRDDFLDKFNLTNREKQVVRCVMSNANDREVAKHLSISPMTLKKHLHNIYTKLGVESRMQLYSLIYGIGN